MATNIKWLLLLLKDYPLRRICKLIHSNSSFHKVGSVSNECFLLYLQGGQRWAL